MNTEHIYPNTRITFIIILVGVMVVLGVGIGTVQADESAEIVAADPGETTDLTAGTDQTIELVIDYDLGGKEPSHVNVGMSEDGHNQDFEQIDISDKDSNDQVTVSFDWYIEDDWDEAVARASVYPEDEIGTSGNDRAYYGIEGSSSEVDSNPEEILAQALDEDGDGISSTVVTVERTDDEEFEFLVTDNNGFIEFSDQSFLDPGSYRLHSYSDSDQSLYYGYVNTHLSDGETLHEEIERGGVYLLDHSATGTIDSSDSLLAQPGGTIEFDLDLYRPRNGDSVTVEVYLSEEGGDFDTLPDKEYEISNVGSDRLTETIQIQTPNDPGQYDVRFDIVTQFYELNIEEQTDRYKAPQFEVVELEPPTIESSYPNSDHQTITGDEEREFSIEPSSDIDTDRSITWKVDGSKVSTDDSFVMSGADYNTGEYDLSVSVSDEYDKIESTESWTVDVEDKIDPDIQIDPSNPRTGEDVTFDASGSTVAGSDDSIAEYEWDTTGDGNVDTAGPVAVESFEEGTHTVGVTLTSESGLEQYTETTVEVDPDQASVRITATDTEFHVDQSTTIEYSVTNFISSEELTVQLLLEKPSDVAVTDIQNARGTNQFTAVGTVPPGQQETIVIVLEPNTAQSFEVTAIADYYVADNEENTDRKSKLLQFDVTDDQSATDDSSSSGDDTSTSVDDESTNDDTPGFGFPSVILAIIGVGYMIRRRTLTQNVLSIS